MPETELEYDEQGRVSGGHFRKHDVSHQIIEEFMLTANEAVAGTAGGAGRAVPAPRPPRPRPAEAGGVRRLRPQPRLQDGAASDRFALQRILQQSADKPEVYAVHYALLRSLKQAVYSPADEGHYALASDDYCHFTSPIRRYPDLTVHRQLGQCLRTGKAGGDAAELAALGEHCSKMERRAETAERELVKLKLLTYLSERLGTELEVIITGVADYGFFGQAETLPVEGLVHVSTLTRRLLLLRGGDAQPDRPAHRPALPAGRQGAGRGGARRSAAAAARFPRGGSARGGGEGKAAGEATAGVMRGKPVPSASEVRP